MYPPAPLTTTLRVFVPPVIVDWVIEIAKFKGAVQGNSPQSSIDAQLVGGVIIETIFSISQESNVEVVTSIIA